MNVAIFGDCTNFVSFLSPDLDRVMSDLVVDRPMIIVIFKRMIDSVPSFVRWK